jgi:hypothetical protein
MSGLIYYREAVVPVKFALPEKRKEVTVICYFFFMKKGINRNISNSVKN